MEEAALLDRAGRLRALLVRDPAAGARRHRGHDDLRVPQRVERVPVRGGARRQPRAAGDGRDVQLHLGRADAVGASSPRRDDRDGAGDRARPARAAAHRQGPDRRRGQGRRSADERRPDASPARASSSATARSRRCTASTSRSRPASSSRCSGLRARARRRRCASSPASSRRTTGACCSTATTSPHARAGRARRRDGVPELRALSAHDGVREHRAFRCGWSARRSDEIDARGARRGGERAHRSPARAPARPALRRPAAALRAGARDRAQAARCSCSTSRCRTSTRSCASRRASSCASCSARSA